MPDPIKKFNFNSVLVGIILGIIMPILAFYVNYLIHFNGMHLYKVFWVIKRGEMQFPLYTLCLLPNLCGFFIFIWMDKDRISRGLLYTILPYVIFMVWQFSNQ